MHDGCSDNCTKKQGLLKNTELLKEHHVEITPDGELICPGTIPKKSDGCNRGTCYGSHGLVMTGSGLDFPCDHFPMVAKGRGLMTDEIRKRATNTML